ncbi:MAG: LytTR family DNA-binding domain-containing protein [Panacibacter sp.]
MKALIVDDEENLRLALLFLLQQHCANINVVAMASSAETARQLLAENEVDIIFLDIQMPGENGFNFLETIQVEKYSIVFVTAYEQYAVKAFKASAVDYLLKPVDVDELKQTAARLEYLHQLKQRNSNQENNYTSVLKELMQSFKSNTGIKKIAISHQYGFSLLQTNEIVYLEADNNYTVFHLSDKRKIVASKTLSDFEELLNENNFFRIHKSTIINLNYLKSYSKVDGDYAVLSDGSSLIVSRRRLQSFLQKINTFTA